jgi:hypothetical protein
MCLTTPSAAQITTRDLSVLAPDDLVRSLLGPGISFSNVRFSGAMAGAGTFSGGASIGFDGGVILSSGSIAAITGPNDSDGTSTLLDGAGDPDLDALIPGGTTYDAAVLSFDFVPQSDRIAFQYVFGSDEYNEYVAQGFNDLFAFFVNDVNHAILPGTTTPVSIDTVNAGVNPVVYVDNDCDDTGCPIDVEADGFTEVLTFAAPVNRDQTNRIKLAIADTRDLTLDSWVFIQAGTLAATSARADAEAAGRQVTVNCSVGDTERGAGSCEAQGFARAPAPALTEGVRQEANGQLEAVTKRVTGKFKRGRRRLRLRLNARGKQLLKNSAEGEITVLVRTSVRDRAGRTTALQALVTLLRRR